jgi:pimeloyl-ACP methyl ester carboxylesterase
MRRPRLHPLPLLLLLLLLSCGLGASGCATHSAVTYRSHTLMFSGEGQPVHIDSQPVKGKGQPKQDAPAETSPCVISPADDGVVRSTPPVEAVTQSPRHALSPKRFFKAESCTDYRDHLDEVFDGLRASNKKKILIYIHGGLNDRPSSLERVETLVGCTPDTGCLGDQYYPIFINWSSSLPSSYRDHLTRVRQGELRPVRAKLTSPWIFGEDLVTALASLPSSMAEELTDSASSRNDSGFQRAYCDYKQGRLNMDVYIGQDCRGTLQSFTDKTKYIPFGVLKVATLPVIDGFGEAAWGVLKRRTNLLFERETLPRYPGDDAAEGDGPLSAFFRKLRQAKKDDPSLELTIVGHSMGAIIVNRALRHFGDLDFKNVVYMAAACTLQDYYGTMFGGAGEKIKAGTTGQRGYLRRHPNTQLYHLTLQERAEVLESRGGWFEVIPRGSLLVWIDNFLAEPEYRLDKMAGRISNLLRELDRTPQDVRPRVHIKSFDYGKRVAAQQPQGHGGFDDVSFWNPDYWNPQKRMDVSAFQCREVVEVGDCPQLAAVPPPS